MLFYPSCQTKRFPEMKWATIYIIDSYMDYSEYVFDLYPKLYSDLALSCIDLNAYTDAEELSRPCS